MNWEWWLEGVAFGVLFLAACLILEDYFKAKDDKEEPSFEYIAYSDFIRRYADRMQQRLKCDRELAEQAAEAGWENYDGVGTPEDEADEELSYWYAEADQDLINN